MNRYKVIGEVSYYCEWDFVEANSAKEAMDKVENGEVEPSWVDDTSFDATYTPTFAGFISSDTVDEVVEEGTISLSDIMARSDSLFEEDNNE